MKLLLDTCALLWFFDNSSLLSTQAYEEIANHENEVFVSAASAWEIEIKKAKGKLECPDDLLGAITYSRFDVLPITVAHAIKAGSLPKHHKDPFDRMLIAQAMLEKMILVTRDAKIILHYRIPVLQA